MYYIFFFKVRAGRLCEISSVCMRCAASKILGGDPAREGLPGLCLLYRLSFDAWICLHATWSQISVLPAKCTLLESYSSLRIIGLFLSACRFVCRASCCCCRVCRPATGAQRAAATSASCCSRTPTRSSVCSSARPRISRRPRRSPASTTRRLSRRLLAEPLHFTTTMRIIVKQWMYHCLFNLWLWVWMCLWVMCKSIRWRISCCHYRLQNISFSHCQDHFETL